MCSSRLFKTAFLFEGNEGRVYELIVRHFLACVSQDAVGKETTATININGEKVCRPYSAEHFRVV
jgi:DNA topoisomerase IA